MTQMTTDQTSTLPEIDEDITEHDGKAHYVRIKALIEGGPVVALCGKRFVPITIAEAGKFPVCKSCNELLDLLEMMR